ncbi:hypothetical protein LCGC14_2134390 [marine sediment metagenome]|uniref:Uncharacterized protein n=1 Tax=marine sediment metagenome TaxID=412755 RepID=A0A0F9E0E5_9ZZZZ
MKTMISALFALCIFASPAGAVTFSVTESNSEFIEFNQGGTVFRINLADLRQGSVALKSGDLLARLTTLTQVRDLRTSFPLDEPTRMVDPGLTFGEQFFWCDADGNPTPDDTVATTHVCAREDIVTAVFDDATQSFIFTVRLARDCTQDPSFVSCAP